jgi:hypothetical protein
MLPFLFAILTNMGSVSAANDLIDRNTHLSRCRTTIFRRDINDARAAVRNRLCYAPDPWQAAVTIGHLPEKDEAWM